MPRRTIPAITALLVMLLAPTAWAACTLTNLGGTWRFYTYYTGAFSQDDFPLPAWELCQVNIDTATGAILTGKACKDDINTSGKTIAGGTVSFINANLCLVKATVRVRYTNADASTFNSIWTITSAALDQGRTVLTGVGTVTNQASILAGARATFMAVKP